LSLVDPIRFHIVMIMYDRCGGSIGLAAYHSSSKCTVMPDSSTIALNHSNTTWDSSTPTAPSHIVLLGILHSLLWPVACHRNQATYPATQQVHSVKITIVGGWPHHDKIKEQDWLPSRKRKRLTHSVLAPPSPCWDGMLASSLLLGV
jgi:hypothetical protein